MSAMMKPYTSNRCVGSFFVPLPFCASANEAVTISRTAASTTRLIALEVSIHSRVILFHLSRRLHGSPDGATAATAWLLRYVLMPSNPENWTLVGERLCT